MFFKIIRSIYHIFNIINTIYTLFQPYSQFNVASFLNYLFVLSLHDSYLAKSKSYNNFVSSSFIVLLYQIGLFAFACSIKYINEIIFFALIIIFHAIYDCQIANIMNDDYLFEENYEKLPFTQETYAIVV